MGGLVAILQSMQLLVTCTYVYDVYMCYAYTGACCMHIYYKYLQISRDILCMYVKNEYIIYIYKHGSVQS